MTSPYSSFLLALDSLPQLDTSVLTDRLGYDYQQFLQRRWAVSAGHFTHVMVPSLGSEQEVEVDVDEDTGRHSYRSPLSGRTIVQSLVGVVLYSIQTDCWLADLAALIGIEERRRSSQICRIPNHLWHPGEQRIVGTCGFAPVLVVRAWSRAPQDEITAVLADTVRPRGSAVLRPRRTNASLPRDHTLHGFDEFVRLTDGVDASDTDASDRVLRGYATDVGEPEPVQFFNGKRLKLPHMTPPIELTEARAKIIKLMWGTKGSTPPVMSWREVNGPVAVNTDFQSFDDAFGDRVAREEVIELVSCGKYWVRRNT